MRSASAALFVLLVCYTPTSAKLITYYRMDSLALMSTDIVLCDEVGYAEKKGKPSGDYVPTYYEFTLRVVRAVKGARKPGEQLLVELDSLYSRRHMDTWPDQPKPAPFPLGRGLFFLNRTDGVWKPVRGGVKLLIDGETYCYGQFVSNPGGLWLARMAPENITIPMTEAYDEGFLLVDLGAALEKAKSLKQPTGTFADNPGIIRRDYQPAPPATPPAEEPPPPQTEHVTGWIGVIGVGILLLVLVLINLPWKRRRPAA